MSITLDKAHAIARSKQRLPAEWLHRIERIEQCPSKTYIAALGAALLAKATDPRVDSLARTGPPAPTGTPSGASESSWPPRPLATAITSARPARGR